MRYFCFIIVFFISACATQPSVFNLNSGLVKVQDTGLIKNDLKSENNKEPIAFVANLVDLRTDKSNLGIMGNKTIVADVIPLLEKALLNNGFFFENSDESINDKADVQSNCSLDIGLKLAYIKPLNTSKVTNVILAVKSKESEKYHYYRGSLVTINWTNGDEEINNDFYKALNDSITSVINAKEMLCSKKNNITKIHTIINNRL